MSSKSAIEWTNQTWNPVVGCTRASDGCDNCYAVKMTRRLEAMGQKDYAGLTTAKHFNGVVRPLEHRLDDPLRWKKPRMVFVNSMSDLFHKDVPTEFIAKVWDVMVRTPQHTYQILTKRPERMAAVLGPRGIGFYAVEGPVPRPQPNIWLGTSVENQEAAEKRIPLLLQTPAAVRFLSCEPLLGPVDLSRWMPDRGKICYVSPQYAAETGAKLGDNMVINPVGGSLDWVIVGGESGPGARPCNVSWIRSIIQQCKVAGVACFVKQLGSQPFDSDCPDIGQFDGSCGHTMTLDDGRHCLRLKSSKGGDPPEWPEELRVREFPAPPT